MRARPLPVKASQELAGGARTWQRGRPMGKLLAFLLFAGVVAGLTFAVLHPRPAARAVAHGLRAAWEWVETLSTPEPPTRRPGRHSPPARAVARAPAPSLPQRAGRDGIVAQPNKESLQPHDRAALDRLVSTRR